MRRRAKIIEPIVRDIAVRYRDALLVDDVTPAIPPGERAIVRSAAKARLNVDFNPRRQGGPQVRFGGRIVVLNREKCFGRFGCVINRAPPDDAKDYPREAVISISGPRTEDDGLRFPGQLRVLHLSFDDLTLDERTDDDARATFFDEAMRQQILAFVDGLPPKTTLYIHCAAGISRSRAVAAAIRRLREEDDLIEFIDGQPNGHVYRLMLGLPPLPVVWKIHGAIARDVVSEYRERRQQGVESK